MWGSASTASASGKKSERRTRNSSSTFFCIPNLQSRLISSFGMQLIAAVNSTNWKIVTLFMFLIGRTELLSNILATVENRNKIGHYFHKRHLPIFCYFNFTLLENFLDQHGNFSSLVLMR